MKIHYNKHNRCLFDVKKMLFSMAVIKDKCLILDPENSFINDNLFQFTIIKSSSMKRAIPINRDTGE